MVVREPWPGMTVTSSGRVRRRSRMEVMSWAVLPPGRSVRPTEPAKRVSPARRRVWSGR
jgi:hypothetical protein